MTASVLLVPFFLVRFVLLIVLNMEAFKNTQKFAPISQPFVLVIYQIAQLLLIVISFLSKITVTSFLVIIGSFFYLIGIVILTMSVVAFSKADQSQLIQSGIYALSRNPMYLAYYLYYGGIGLLIANSWYIVVLVVFVWTSHRIILSEEAWCLDTFGDAYAIYAKKVPRYF